VTPADSEVTGAVQSRDAKPIPFVRSDGAGELAGTAARGHLAEPVCVRATADCFEELTTSLAWIVEHTSEASSAARRLAATTDQSRSFGGPSMTTPPPPVEGHRNRRRSVASGIESQSADPAADRSLELS
jgi:hypothetical protein